MCTCPDTRPRPRARRPTERRLPPTSIHRQTQSRDVTLTP
jgi:hypothetical protein